MRNRFGQRGRGRGIGGTRQGIGGPIYCQCPSCNKKIKHIVGHPCAFQTCPDCGIRLIGTN